MLLNLQHAAENCLVLSNVSNTFVEQVNTQVLV